MRNDQRIRYAWLLVALLAMTLPVIAGCGSGVGTNAALPTGWSMYRDTKVPFQIPVPPQWQAASLDDGPLNDEHCIYTVDFFPPGAPVDRTKVGQIHEAWLAKIDVHLTCPPWRPSDDHWFKSEAKPVTISGSKATAYNDCKGTFVVERDVVVMFGGHQFIFKVHSYKSPDETTHVYAIFDQMLRGFQYSGL